MIQYFAIDKNFKKIDDYESGCWINVINPSQNEVNDICGKFNLPDYFLTDIADIEERPRTDREDRWTYAIIQVPKMSKNDDGDFIYSTVPMALMFKDSVFITAYYNDNDIITNFIKWKKQRNITEYTVQNVFIALFFEAAFHYLKYLKQIHAQMKRSEKRIKEKMNQDSLERIMHIEKYLVYFISSMRDNESVLMRIKRYFSNIKYDEDLLEDSEIELHQAITTANIYSNIIEHQQSSYSAIISNNLNNTMKNMTMITICLMCAALVPGFYGMNLINGLGTWGLGLVMDIVLSIVSGIGGYFICKKFEVF